MIKMIAACSLNSIIGKDNLLPWGNEYSEDLKFFRKMTSDSTIIMGRKTFNSIGRCLPKRRNVIISRSDLVVEGAECFKSLEDALEATKNDETVWIIGGSSMYQEGLKYAQEIYLTTIPHIIDGDTYFPFINPDLFDVKEIIQVDENLKCRVYVKR